jgi:uncharacterized repeat protein (TIGR01451 family)
MSNRARRRPRRLIPWLEVLDERTLPSSVTLTSVADNTLYQDPTGHLSNGAGTEMYVGTTKQTSNTIRRAVLRFDLSSIPAGSTINSVTLTLHESKTAAGAGTQTISAHALTSSWGEGTSNAATGGTGSGQGDGIQATTNDATWLYTFYNTKQWTTAGGDFSSTVSSSTTVNGIGSYSWSGTGMVSDVQGWLSSAATNFGWILIGGESVNGTAKEFDTRENVAANRPTLVVQYTPPPDLTITKTHSGNFVQGDAADTYTITVTNSGGATTSGTVTATDTLPTGLSPTTADNGTVNGWSVSFSGQTITATRGDALAGGSSYPNLTLTVAVASNAPSSVTNTATVAGGGEQNTSNDSASDPTTINTPPDLRIAKSHTGNFRQGDAHDTYTITVTNHGGTATTAAVTVTDTLPTGLSPTAADSGTINGWAVSTSGQTVTATRADVLAAAASYPSLTLTVAVAADAPASVTNTATVAGGGESNTSDDSASDPTTITQVADLTVTKSHSGTFTQGDAADTYAIGVGNSGPGPTSAAVIVTDTLPSGLSPTSADGGTIAGWAVSFSGQTITATRSDTLASGAGYPGLTLTVAVAADAPASVTNTATVSGGGELNTANDSASDPTTINPVPDLTIALSHTGNFTEGDAADTYAIRVSNIALGAAAGTVTVSNTLPAGLAPTAADSGTIAGWAVSFSGQTITAIRSDVLAGQASYPDLPLTVAVADNAPASVANTATVAGGGELNTANDGGSDTIPINLLPDLTIAMSHAGDFRQGDAVDTYTFVVANAGGAATSDTVTVTDTLPDGLVPTEADNGSVAGWSVSFSGQVITATRGDALAAGSQYAALPILVSVTADAPAGVTNTATVSGGGETDTADDSASDPTTITQVADLTIALSHGGTFTQGDAADTYTIVVGNSGPGPTSGAVTVTDALPGGLMPTSADSGTIAGWAVSFSGQTVTATRTDTLASGASYPGLTLTVAVAADAPGSLTNTATVAGGGELNGANDSASDPTSINPVADLTIALSHTTDFTEGDAADTYTIRVSNVALGATSGTVTVIDTLPAGLAPTAADTGTINGWAVSFSGQTVTATRSDVLTGGSSYPDLPLTVSVDSSAPARVTNTAAVSGGGELNTANDSASDPTAITLLPDLTVALRHSDPFRQGDTADVYTVTVVNRGRGASAGAVTVTDTLPVGLAPTAADSGTMNGWVVSASGQTISATRDDVLAAGASYPDLPIAVAVAADAPASLTNTATVAGGGENNTSNDSAGDPTTIVQVADLTITGAHAGRFTHGDGADRLTITVINSGPGPTRGVVTVIDSLPTGLTPTAADTGTIAGWTVSSGGQTITATRSDGLASGAAYPALAVTVAVAADAPASAVDTLSVSGGGELNLANDTANDPIATANAAPTVALPASATTPEETPLTLTGISVSDIDSGGASELVIFSVTDGTLAVNTTVSGGLTASAVLANNSAAVTLTGSVAQIDATLADAHGLVYTPAVGFAGTAGMTLYANDLGNSGGGALSAMGTESIAVTRVLDHYTMDVPASVVAGVPFTVTVTARDHAGADIANFAGTVLLSGAELHGLQPLTLAGGIGHFTATLQTAGSQTFVATDANTPSYTVQATLSVLPAAAAQLVFVQEPTTTLAAAAFTTPVSVMALDAFGNVVTTDNRDIVTIALRGAPAGTRLSGTTSITLTGGVAVFPSLQLNRSATALSLLATSSTLPAVQSAPFDVSTVARFIVTATPTTLVAGTDLTVSVSAVDSRGQPVSDYDRVVHFSSTDPQAGLPADLPLTQGQGSFTIRPATAGAFTATVVDVGKPSVTGRLVRPVTVTPADVQALAITGATGPFTAGAAHRVTVSAVDAFGNANPSYRGTVTLTSADSAAMLPGAHPYTSRDAGRFAFTVTLRTPGLRAITAAADTLSVTQPNIPVVGRSVTVLTQPDPQDDANTALVVIGTTGRDAIDIAPASADGTQVEVSVNGVVQGTFAPTGHILVFGVAGTDSIRLRTGTGSLAGVQVAVPAIITAGTGTVTVDASGSLANNILIGGPGHVTLTAGSGSDILIGGAGTAVLRAGAGSDLLIGGTTNYDANTVALMQLMDEWGNPATSYLTRIEHLTGALPDGANAPTAFLNRATAHSGSAVSRLIGAGALDWFLGRSPDVVENLVSGEVITPI